MGPGMAKFIAIVSYEGEIPADYTEQPAPDPAMFGLPTEDDGSRDDALIGAEPARLYVVPAGLRRAGQGERQDRHRHR